MSNEFSDLSAALIDISTKAVDYAGCDKTFLTTAWKKVDDKYTVIYAGEEYDIENYSGCDITPPVKVWVTLPEGKLNQMYISSAQYVATYRNLWTEFFEFGGELDDTD